MNPLSAAWEKFLRWCRTYSTEPLTFDQKIARHVTCRLDGHDKWQALSEVAVVTPERNRG
jgi:hypothetical protein